MESILPPELLESLNEDQETVEVPEIPARADKEEFTQDPKGYNELEDDWGDDEPGWEEFGEELEKAEGPSTEEELESLSEAAIDLLHVTKDGLSSLYDARFSKALKRKFGQDKRLHLILVETLYYEDKLNLDNLTSLLKATQAKNEAFASVDLIDLLEVGNEYKGLRKRYRTKPINEKTEAGIRRNLHLTLRKYMNTSLDPSILLVFYLVAAFAPDAINLFTIIREEKAGR